MLYGEWYGVCDVAVFSVVEVCVDYGSVLRLGVVCCVVM